jgi:hypothetical protein
MKTIVLVLAMVLMATTAMATGQECYEPKPVELVCNCNCTETQLPGLWKVNIAGKMLCGTITVIANGFLLQEQGAGSIYPAPEIPRGSSYFMSNAWKRARQVPYCD